MSDTDAPGLALPFDTDDPEFVRGVQVGSLWAQWNMNPDPFSMMLYAENAEMIARIIERSDVCRPHVIEFHDEWAQVDAEAIA